MGTKGRDGAGEFKLSEPIWARGEHEPKLWFQRFMSYLQMGRKRSKLAVYKHERLSFSGARHTLEGREKA